MIDNPLKEKKELEVEKEVDNELDKKQVEDPEEESKTKLKEDT